LGGVFVFLLMGVLDQRHAASAVSGQTLVVIASGFAIARSLTTSGAAGHLAKIISKVCSPGGQL
jgi:di/tricarboxylate transporter